MEKIQPDQQTKTRQKIYLICIILGAVIPAISKSYLYQRFIVHGQSSIGSTLGYFVGSWSVTVAFAFLLYFLGRWKLQPTFIENRKKLLRGMILAMLFLCFAFVSGVKETIVFTSKTQINQAP